MRKLVAAAPRVAGLKAWDGGLPENLAYPFDEMRDWHYGCIKNFVKSCAGRAKPLVTPEQAVFAQKLIARLCHSAETGKPVYPDHT